MSDEHQGKDAAKQATADDVEKAQQTLDTFRDALDAVERAAADPVVPGELEAWVGDVRPPAQRVDAGLPDLEGLHDDILKQVGRRDAALLQRAKAEREKGEALRADWSKLLEDLTSLEEDAASGEGSWEPAGALESMRKELLEWVVRARAHDAAVRTWLVESEYRDRGFVD